MVYKKITGRNGVRYMRDGKLMKTADVPAEIVEQLEDHASVEEHQRTDRSCIFCGMFGKYPRLINGHTIYTCEVDYYSKTVGQCVQKLNQGVSHAEVNAHQTS